MNAIFAIAAKDICLLLRDKGGVFWVIGFPILMAVLMGTMFRGGGGDSKMALAVIDKDRSAGSTAFIAKLGALSGVRVIDPAPTEQEARDLVRRGRAVASVVLKPGFGETMGLFGGSGEPLMVVAADPSRSAEAGFLEGMLTQSAFQVLAGRFQDRSWIASQTAGALRSIEADSGLAEGDRSTLRTMLKSLNDFAGSASDSLLAAGPFGMGTGGAAAETSGSMGLAIGKEEVVRERTNSYAITFPQGVLWGLIGATAAFAISLVGERQQGTLVRLRMAPLSRAQLLAGKGVACFATCLAITLLLLAIAVLIFDVRVHQPMLLAAATLCVCFCFTGMMMLIATFGRTESAVDGAGRGILLLFAMIGGGMFPLMLMPAWLFKVSSFSPVKWAIYALEGALWRRFSVSEMLLPCGILLAIGVVSFAVGVLRFRKIDG